MNEYERIGGFKWPSAGRLALMGFALLVGVAGLFGLSAVTDDGDDQPEDASAPASAQGSTTSSTAAPNGALDFCGAYLVAVEELPARPRAGVDFVARKQAFLDFVVPLDQLVEASDGLPVHADVVAASDAYRRVLTIAEDREFQFSADDLEVALALEALSPAFQKVVTFADVECA